MKTEVSLTTKTWLLNDVEDGGRKRSIWSRRWGWWVWDCWHWQGVIRKMTKLRMFCRWWSQSGENWCRSISHKDTLSLHQCPAGQLVHPSVIFVFIVATQNIPWISYRADVTDLNFKGRRPYRFWWLHIFRASHPRKRYLRRVGGSVRQIMILSTQLISVVEANLWYPRIPQPALMGLGITMALQTRKENMVFTFSLPGNLYQDWFSTKKYLFLKNHFKNHLNFVLSKCKEKTLLRKRGFENSR